MKSYGLTGSEPSGFYTPTDLSELNLIGATGDKYRTYLSLSFVPCSKSDQLQVECASDEKLRTFLKDKVFILWGAANFIEFEEVMPAEETLK